LPWARRCNIIVGVATGLHYLHSQRSVHGSVKVSNVLLDPDFTVRLGDFGYSRLGPLKNRATAGTPYLAPECIYSGTLNTNPTYEQDVFYFGAMVLEVVCGRRRSAYVVTGDFKLFLVDWVWMLHRKGRILDAVDATLMAGGEVDQAVARRLLLVGLGCSHPDPKQRPKMEDVVKHMQSDDGVPPITVPLFNPRYDHAPP
jgi:serine/threonine protein kinase